MATTTRRRYSAEYRQRLIELARGALCVNVGETIFPSEIREGGEARNW